MEKPRDKLLPGADVPGEGEQAKCECRDMKRKGQESRVHSGGTKVENGAETLRGRPRLTPLSRCFQHLAECLERAAAQMFVV